MKSAFIFLLLIICFLSCSLPGAKVQSYSDSLGQADISKQAISTAPIPQFKKLDTIVPFSGVWVNAIYVQRIRDNRSPRLSQNVAESCIIIPGRTLQVTRMVGGFHDGAADMVVLKNGDHYAFYSADLTLFMKDIALASDGLIRIGDQSFIRLNNPDTTLTDWGILEECLFQGKYMDQQGRPIIFAANGYVSGLDSFRFYVPQIDYTELNEPVDHIQLGRSARHIKDFGFRFDKDSLIIYTINCLRYNAGEKQCDSEALGEKLYTLVRTADESRRPDNLRMTSTDSLGILSKKWKNDSLGCDNVRSIDLFDRIIKGYSLEQKSEAEFLKILGTPNKEEKYIEKTMLIYYFQSLCRADTIGKGSDKSSIRITFNLQKQYRSYDTRIE